jgi:hypothetical protein
VGAEKAVAVNLLGQPHRLECHHEHTGRIVLLDDKLDEISGQDGIGWELQIFPPPPPQGTKDEVKEWLL